MEKQYTLYATDFDNTLVPLGEQGPHKDVEQAIKNLRKQGVTFAICTGRALSALCANPCLKGKVKYDYAVCNNGAHVVDAKGQTIYKMPLTAEEMYVLVDFCEDYDYPLQFAFSDGYYSYVGYDLVKDLFDQLEKAGTGLSIVDGEDQDRHLEEMPATAFAMLPPDGKKRFEEKYGYLGLEFMPVTGVYPLNEWCCYDIMHKGVDKSEGLKGLCEALKIPMEQVVATGDGHNDIGMIRAAGLGCAMGNASPEVKAAADRVLPDVRAEGVAPLLQELWSCTKE